jgi:transposase
MGKIRVHRPESEWRELVAAWRASGMSAREFAHRRKLSVSTLFAWARRLAGREGSTEREKRRKPARFAEVRVVERPAEAGPLEVMAPSGYVVRVRGVVDREALRTVLEEVGRC